MNEINIGKNITKFRRSKGITQDELASYIGAVSYTHLDVYKRQV